MTPIRRNHASPGLPLLLVLRRDRSTVCRNGKALHSRVRMDVGTVVQGVETGTMYCGSIHSCRKYYGRLLLYCTRILHGERVDRHM